MAQSSRIGLGNVASYSKIGTCTVCARPIRASSSPVAANAARARRQTNTRMIRFHSIATPLSEYAARLRRQVGRHYSPNRVINARVARLTDSMRDVNWPTHSPLQRHGRDWKGQPIPYQSARCRLVQQETQGLAGASFEIDGCDPS